MIVVGFFPVVEVVFLKRKGELLVASISARDPKTDMIVVRLYAAANLNELSDRLHLVFSPWIEAVNNNDADEDLDEVCDEEGGCDNPCVNYQTARGDQS